MKKLKILVAIQAAVLLAACASPSNKMQDLTEKKIGTMEKLIEDKTITAADIDNTYTEKEDYVLLGTPFMREESSQLPEAINMPVKFNVDGKKDLYQIVEYLNTKYSPYNITIGFSSDAVEYLTGSTKTSNNSSGTENSDATNKTSDSSASLLSLSDTNDLSASKSSLSNIGIKMGLNYHNEVTLSHVLGDIATRTNLWWKYNDQHQVVFYRYVTKFYKFDVHSTTTSYSSSIGSQSNSSGGDSQATSNSAAGSQTYSLTDQGENPITQLQEALTALKSDGGKVSVMSKLGLIAVTDTPDKQLDMQRVIAQSNLVTNQMVHLRVEIWRMVTDKNSDYGLQADIKRATGSSTASLTGINTNGSSSAGLGMILGGAWDNSVAKLRTLQTVKSMTLQKAFTTTVPSRSVVPLQKVSEQGYLSGSSLSSSDGVVQSGSETATTTNGISLLVSPTINSDGSIFVRVLTNISNLNSLDDISDGQTNFKRPNRDVLTTNAERNVLNGDTVLITSLVEDTNNGENQSLFGKYLWFLGGSDSAGTEHTTLLIVVQPTIERV